MLLSAAAGKLTKMLTFALFCIRALDIFFAAALEYKFLDHEILLSPKSKLANCVPLSRWGFSNLTSQAGVPPLHLDLADLGGTIFKQTCDHLNSVQHQPP